MVVAPEIFLSVNVAKALSMVDCYLAEGLADPKSRQLGLATLSPADPEYNGIYNNEDNSTSPFTTLGANYHNGPEWLWTVGYYLRSRLLHLGDRLITRYL